MTPEDKKNPWPWAVGILIMNFGTIEAASCQWIYELTQDQSARDKAINLQLGQRLKLVIGLVSNSSLSANRKKKALEMWNAVIELSKIRNKIAHSPFITNPQQQSGFIDIKEMKGVLDGQPKPVSPSTFSDIHDAATKTKKIIHELLTFF